MFHLADKTEDLSPGHSISDNPEGLLQRRKEKSQDIGIFATKIPGGRNTKNYCELRKTRHLKLRNVALFYVWEDAKPGLIPLIHTSDIWGQYAVFPS